MRITALMTATAILLWAQGSRGHGILPDEIPMAAGTALREPGPLPILSLTFMAHWAPEKLTLVQDTAALLEIHNRSDDWHLFALGDPKALRDQQLIHRLMPDLRKDYPNTRLSEPGSRVALPWRFDRPGTFSLRCVRADHQGHPSALTIQIAPSR